MLLCILATASPAQAETFDGLAFAGPSIAGDTVVWGQERPDGSARVLSHDAGARTRVVQRIPAANGRNRKRDFGGVPGALSASPTRVAYALQYGITTQIESDFVGIESSVKAQVSVNGGAFTDPLDCKASYVTTAVEGDTVAIGANTRQPCSGVWIAGTPARRVALAPRVHQVRLAGPYVAWLERIEDGLEQITVAEHATGATVATYTAPSPPKAFNVFDLDDQGNVVTMRENDVIAFTPGNPTPRVLARDVWSLTVATAAGRIAYISTRRFSPDRLLLVDLQGRVLRRLDRYTSARQPVGELALTGDRVAWSVLRGRGDFHTLRRPRGNVLSLAL